MSEFNLSIEKTTNSFGTDMLSVKSDKPIRDVWEDEEISDFNYEIEAYSLTELHNKLYDLSQSQDCIPNDVEFKVDGVLFSQMIGGFHLDPNMNFPEDLISKYANEETLEISTGNVLKKVYGDDEAVDGVTLYKEGDTIAYHGYDAGNHIRGEDGSNVFKNKDEALEAVRYYIEKDSNAYISTFDKTNVKVDGESIGVLSHGILSKPDNQEEPDLEKKQENKSRNRRKPS